MVNVNNIHIKNVSKTFYHFSDSKVVLNSIDTSLLNSEITFLCGLNGSGKTTLFRIIAGVLKQDEKNKSSIEFDNKNQSTKELQKKVLFIPQNIDDAFVNDLFVFEYVSLFNLNVIKNFAIKIDADWLNEIIEKKSKTLLRELSQGERQLLLLLVLLSKEEKIILFDEVFSSIDANYHKKLWELIRDTVKERNLISLFITHDYDFAFDNAERVLVLFDGNLVLDEYNSKISKEIFMNKIHKG